ncbi:hypothetical protein HK100_000951 [Physocladia obscura]|uniref:Uncharacterized protein n=1 Tax=Physocladia obscura TaxID=109957 RepID=A0AAD5TCJ0_9FUNG|nr:hypothetical protein HK100_000951 [Physocladia obscura]
MSFVGSVGPATRMVVGLAAGLSLASILCRIILSETLDGWNRPFEVIVGFMISRFWTYATAGFVETNPLLV